MDGPQRTVIISDLGSFRPMLPGGKLARPSRQMVSAAALHARLSRASVPAPQARRTRLRCSGALACTLCVSIAQAGTPQYAPPEAWSAQLAHGTLVGMLRATGQVQDPKQLAGLMRDGALSASAGDMW